MSAPRLLRRLAAAAVVVSLTSVHAQIVVNDTFTDTDRIGGLPGTASTHADSPVTNDPTSTNTQWIRNKTGMFLIASASGLNWITGAGTTTNQLITGYCPAVSLATTGTVHLTLTFTTGALGTTTGDFAIAFFDGSPTGYRKTDGVGSTDATYVGDTGYRIGFTNFGGGTAAAPTLRVYYRSDTTSNNLLGTSANWTGLGTAAVSAGAGSTLQADTAYTFELTLTRITAADVQLTAALTGGNLTGLTTTVHDTTGNVWNNFDQLSLRLATGANQYATINLTSWKIDLTPAGSPTAPTITTQPLPRTAVVGDAVTFTVAASGTTPFTYLWRKDTVAIDPVANPSAATASLALTAVQLADAGSYDCIVTNSVDSATSNAAGLIVNAAATPPSITTHPADQTVGENTAASFTVAAAGTPPLSYQWRKNTVTLDPIAMPSAATATLGFTHAHLADAGSYDCIVTNSVDSATSQAATLTVIAPPLITASPTDATVSAGTAVTFSVYATGDGMLTYQWRKNAMVIPGATNPTYTIASPTYADASTYDCIVANLGGPVTSAGAVLTVNSGPVIVTSPASQIVLVGGPATLTVVVGGNAPFTYAWRKNGNPVADSNAPALVLTNVQFADAGSYEVVVTNGLGNTTSLAATLRVSVGLPNSSFNLTGFATLGSGTTGGGLLPDTDATYRKCSTALELATAIRDANKTAGVVRVIEIMNDLNLGWNELDAATKALTSAPFRAHATPKLHPTLIASGVSLLDITAKNGLTIFSANGATIRHCTFNLKGTSNIMIRNLKFDEMWEWDEDTKGNYDTNDWDFIDLSNGSAATNIWIDHCTFTKTYDGILDMKAGTQYVTLSWCTYVGDDGASNANSMVRQQIAALEANSGAYAFYNFLRTHGFSTEDIAQIIQGHDKAHLLGSNSLDAGNNTLSATFHHQWFCNLWDRCVPRLRGGQVHDYNILVDDSTALVARRLRNLRAAAMSAGDQNTLNNTYSFNPFLNGSISTEGGALLVEKSVYQDCLYPLRNNQTDVTKPVYTGKIQSTDTIYILHNADGSTTTVRGDSTDAGSPMGPFQAAIIPFAWNTSDGSRPYPAPAMDDPANLPQILAAGAGAGKLYWSKDNWLRTSYIDTAPVLLTSPASQNLALNSTGSLTVVAVGPGTLTYQWRKDGAALDTVANPSAATDTLVLLNAQSADAGTYDCVVANAVGSAPSAAAVVTVTQSYTAWAATFGLGAGSGGDDTDGDGLTNLAEYALNLSPIAPDSSSGPTLTLEAGQYVFRFTRPKWATGVTYTVQLSTDLVAWIPSPSAPIVESATASSETLIVALDASVPRRFARLQITAP